MYFITDSNSDKIKSIFQIDFYQKIDKQYRACYYYKYIEHVHLFNLHNLVQYIQLLEQKLHC